RLLLHRELHVEPDPETRALFEQLKLEARKRPAGGALGAWRLALGPSTAGPALAGPSAKRQAPSAASPAPPGSRVVLLSRQSGEPDAVLLESLETRLA